MNSKMHALRQRRSEILARIASQRDQVAEVGARLQGTFALVDQGLAVARYLRSNPVLAVGVAALLVVSRRGLVGLGMALWKGWRLYRLAKSFLSNPANHG